jgi:uncharacterized protein YhfF
MQPDNRLAAAFWRRYFDTLPVGNAHRASRFDALCFGDTPALADELAALVRSGVKKATASLPVEFTSLGLPLPSPGDVSIVTLFDGTPVAIIELVEVRHLPFDAVDESFAEEEGEGDRTLASWRAAHREYFGRVSARHGLPFDDRTTVICQRFKLVVGGV